MITCEQSSVPFCHLTAKGITVAISLLTLIEDWKKALNGCHFVGAILMDMANAFDCLLH